MSLVRRADYELVSFLRLIWRGIVVCRTRGIDSGIGVASIVSSIPLPQGARGLERALRHKELLKA